MIDPWDAEALWIKAQMFVNRAMDPDEHRSFDEQALWASLALELLGKAALAGHSPALIAVPSEDGANLLAATGLTARTGKFTSIQAKTVNARCARAFKPFNQDRAQRIADARNEYLHGAGLPFAAIPPDAWWAQYWGEASILIHACERTLEDLVGGDRVRFVEAHLARNKKNLEDRAEMLLDRARKMKALHESGQLTGRLAVKWEEFAGSPLAGLKYSDSSVCPACGATGVIEGDDAESYEEYVEQWGGDLDNFDVGIRVSVGTLCFVCEECHLAIDDPELLDEVGIPDAFEAEGDPADFVEQEYGND